LNYLQRRQVTGENGSIGQSTQALN